MESDDSDEWATEDLPPIPTISREEHHRFSSSFDSSSGEQQTAAGDDKYWEVPPQPQAQQRTLSPPSPTAKPTDEGRPMLLVDMTELSNGTIHSKFDANAVNDPVAVKSMRITVERQYQTYASDAALLSNRTVIPCGSTVWRPALIQMRQEKPGHYFCPIFPPLPPTPEAK